MANPARSTMDRSGIVPLLESHKRSRKGCWTCKSKKVKCDEEEPECGRCMRLKLNCSWVDPRPLSDQPHQRSESRKRSWKWVSMNEGPMAREKRTPDYNSAPTTMAEAGPADGTSGGDYNVLDSSELEGTDDWWAELLAVPSTLESMQSLGSVGCFGEVLNDDTSLPDGYLPGIGNATNAALSEPNLDENHTYGDPSTLTAGSGGEICSGEVVGVWSSDSVTTSKAYGSLRSDNEADKHLQTGQAAISLSYNSTKDPAWSTVSILIHLSSNQPMMMHLLLAASMKSSAIDRMDELGAGTGSSPEHHFSVGSQLLVGILNNDEHLEPSVNVLATFWLMYMYWANVPNPSRSDIGRQRRLGQISADYIRLHDLLSLCTGKVKTGKGESGVETSSWATRTLVAKMIVWLFYADIWAHFQNHGGQLASYLCENESKAGKVYLTSRTALLANWGSSYPVDLVIDDLETSTALDLLFEVYMRLARVNTYSPERDSNIDEDFRTLEESFSGLFLLTTLERPDSARSRLFQVAHYVVANFYAVQIYCSWYKAPRSFNSLTSTGDFERPLNRLLAILYKNFSDGRPKHRRFQWPFLIAGAETSDLIQRDWILRRMSPDPFKVALEKISAYEKLHKTRPDVSWIRASFSDPEMSDGSSSNMDTAREPLI